MVQEFTLFMNGLTNTMENMAKIELSHVSLQFSDYWY